MGYCMEQIGAEFSIRKEWEQEALQAIKALKGKETCHDSTGSHFSWVDHDYEQARTLGDAMLCWRWALGEATGLFGGIYEGIEFRGEKLGDDDLLFEAIAPWVEHGSYIEMRGEDGQLWRWMFKYRQVRQIYPKWEWD